MFVRVSACCVKQKQNCITYRVEVLSTVQGGQVLNQAICPGDNQAASNHPQDILYIVKNQKILL